MKTILLFATAILLLAALPAQAQKAVIVNQAVDVIGQCDCEEDATTLTEPPKGEDHTWGGDPDYAGPPDRQWVHYWWYIMECVVWPSDCQGTYNIIY